MDQDHIVVSSQHQNMSQDSFFKRLFTNKKLLAIVGVLLAAELVWAGYTLTRPVPPSNFKASTTTSEGSASSSLNSASLSFTGPSTVTVNQTFDVVVMLDVPIETDAADVVINYDPARLEVVESGDLAAKAGQIYSNYPVNSNDPTEGKVILAGATDPGTAAFKGLGTFATITFRAKARGQTALSFDYTKGSTVDSNVVDSHEGRDILESVQDLRLTIND